MDGFFKIGRHFYSRVNLFYEVMKNITIEMSNVTIRYYRDTHFTNHAGYTSHLIIQIWILRIFKYKFIFKIFYKVLLTR